MGPAGRPLRIMAEYLEPLNRFDRLGVRKAVIFFGSARTCPGTSNTPDGLDYCEMARQFAGRVARWTTDTHPEGERYFICTGGGPGIMEAANRGASEQNPLLSMGLNISIPFEQKSNTFINAELDLEFHYFFMRKFWFLNLAKGLVIFPGGFGTMDELFEVLTLVQTGKKEKIPVLLFGRKFWEQMLNFPMFLEHGLISAEDLQLFHLTDNVDDAFEYLKKGLEPATLLPPVSG
ncbi:MAG: TIGR00730 family Rossman fold protein [Nevskiales bacterium]